MHKLPGDLREALISNPTALVAWKDITPLARNEFICWVEDAKQDMTRERRIRRTQEELEGWPASALLLAGLQAPRAHRQIEVGAAHFAWTRRGGGQKRQFDEPSRSLRPDSDSGDTRPWQRPTLGLQLTILDMAVICTCCAMSVDWWVRLRSHPDLPICHNCLGGLNAQRDGQLQLMTGKWLVTGFEPIFKVAALARSVAWFERAGFETSLHDDSYAFAHRDRDLTIHLAQAGVHELPGHGFLYLHCQRCRLG